MGHAVEAVATNPMLFVIPIRNGIHVVSCRHGLVEGCVEGGNLQDTGQQLLTALDNLKGAGVVQRSQMAETLDHLQHLVVDGNGAPVGIAAVGNPMPHGIYLGKALQRTILTHQGIQGKVQGFGAAIGRNAAGSTSPFIHDGEQGIVADALHLTSGQLRGRSIRPFVKGQKLVLQGTGACVEHQYVHACITSRR